MINNISFNLSETPANISFLYDLSADRFVYVDEYLAHLLKKDLINLQPDNLFSYFYDDDLVYLRNRFNDLIEETFSGSVVFRLRVNTDELWVRLTPFLIRTSEEFLIAGNVSNITDEIHNADAVGRYANKKNSILNILSHDLRGPLGIAEAISQALQKESADPRFLKSIQAISGIIKQSMSLIADLIERELVETIDVELFKRRIDLVIKIKEYIDECRRSESITKRSFHLSCSQEEIYIDLDEAKFMQVLNNLMSNALKFTKDGSTISITIQEQADSVLITFSDNGIGIPQTFHAGLFEKFTEARRRGLKGEPTLGLGLFLVKTIIEWHNGNIWFESKENEGTTFYIEIPKVNEKAV